MSHYRAKRNLPIREAMRGKTERDPRREQIGLRYLHRVYQAAPVAVGPPVTRRPPHRSLRAELPHKAPASGRNAQTRFIYPLTYPCQRTLQPFPALSPVAGLLARIAFGQPPFLHQLRRRALTPHFVRRFLRYYGVVRLLRLVHRILIPLGFNARTRRTPFRRADPESSRLPREKRPHMPWFFDRAGAGYALP